MHKFNGLFLTLALSFFTLFLCKLEGDVALTKHTATHKFQDNHSINTSAISINNVFDELLSFDEHENPLSVSHFYTKPTLNKILSDVNTGYLKVCDFFDFSLTIRTIIYPFHSFF